MSTLLVGNCATENLFEIWDADAALETEFEFIVAKTLMCIYSRYLCFPFGGTFKLEGSVSRPDIALVAKDMSHWFIIEVELVSHSLERHVLPQIRTFRYGQPQPDCISVLARELNISRGSIETFMETVPRVVAVIANKRHQEWEIALRSLDTQLLAVTAFNSSAGLQAVEVDGRLVVSQESVGFGHYSATDRSLRFHQGVILPDGDIMVDDYTGVGSLWSVTRDGTFAWVTKSIGTPDIRHGAQVQMIRLLGGRFSLKRPLGYG